MPTAKPMATAATARVSVLTTAGSHFLEHRTTGHDREPEIARLPHAPAKSDIEWAAAYRTRRPIVIWAMTSGLAPSGITALSGSPGARWMSAKHTIDTPSAIGIV